MPAASTFTPSLEASATRWPAPGLDLAGALEDAQAGRAARLDRDVAGGVALRGRDARVGVVIVVLPGTPRAGVWKFASPDSIESATRLLARERVLRRLGDRDQAVGPHAEDRGVLEADLGRPTRARPDEVVLAQHHRLRRVEPLELAGALHLHAAFDESRTAAPVSIRVVRRGRRGRPRREADTHAERREGERADAGEDEGPVADGEPLDAVPAARAGLVLVRRHAGPKSPEPTSLRRTRQYRPTPRAPKAQRSCAVAGHWRGGIESRLCTGARPSRRWCRRLPHERRHHGSRADAPAPPLAVRVPLAGDRRVHHPLHPRAHRDPERGHAERGRRDASAGCRSPSASSSARTSGSARSTTGSTRAA